MIGMTDTLTGTVRWETTVARRSVAQRAVEELERQIANSLVDTPLAAAADLMLENLRGIVSAVESGLATPDQQNETVNCVRQRFDALPQSFGDRFLVDSANAQAIVEACSAGSVELSPMIVPRYGQHWGFQRVGIPYQGNQYQTVDVLLMPGSDDLSSIYLLDYPWLLHEIGHNIHFRSKLFSEQFGPRLTEAIQRRRARVVSDRGVARKRALEAIDAFTSVWTPSTDHKNWAHEIAVDVVALWLCGPAYLATFNQLLTDQKPRPFELTQQHPPYDLRVSALIDAAERLGWSTYTSELKSHCDGWANGADGIEWSNQYLALRDSDLIVASVTCGLATCNEFGLPRLDAEQIKSVRRLLKSPRDCDFGVELIVAAWLAETELPASEFDQWHDQVIAELHRAVTQESH